MIPRSFYDALDAARDALDLPHTPNISPTQEADELELETTIRA